MPGGVRSARDLLASRLPNTNAVPAPVAPASQGPLQPSMGAPAAAPTAPTPAAPAAAPVAPGGTGGVGDPQGAIPGNIIGGGGDWSQVNQWDSQINAAAAKYGVDPSRLKAMMVVESGGDPNAQGAGGAYGLMQVKGGYDANGNCYAWQCFADQNGLGNLQTDPQAQLNVAAAILAGAPGTGGTPGDEDGNFLNIYYPIPGGGTGESGNTQAQYEQALNTLMPIINQSGGAAPPSAQQPLDKSGSVPGAVNPSTPGTPTPTDDQTLPTGTTPGVNQSGSWNEANAMQEAVAQIGKSYGGIPDPSDPNPSSFDCSGLTRYISQRNGAPYVPMGSEAQMQVASDQGILRGGLDGVQPGDLVFFDTNWRGGGYCQPGHPGPSTCGPCLNCASHVGFWVGPTSDCPGGAILGAQTDGVGYMCANAYPVLGNATPGQYAPQTQYGL